MGGGPFVPPGMPSSGGMPVDPGISPSGNVNAAAGEMNPHVKMLQDLVKFIQAKKAAGGSVPGGNPVVSPGRTGVLPQVGGTQTNATPVQPQPTFQPTTVSEPRQFEFNTKQGRDAQTAYMAVQQLAKVVGGIRAKKAQGESNQAYMVTSMYFDALQRGDMKTANAIAEDPKNQKVLEKAFGMMLPTHGKQPQAKPKAEKPNPAKQGALKAIMERIVHGKQQAQATPPNLPMPTPSTEQQAAGQQAALKGQMAQNMSQEISKPGVGSEAAQIALGTRPTASAETEAKARMDAEILRTSTAVTKMQADAENTAARTKAQIDAANVAAKSRIQTAGIAAGSRENVAKISALARMYDADKRFSADMAKVNQATKAGKITDAVTGLSDASRNILGEIQTALKDTSHDRTADVNKMFSRLEQVNGILGDLSKSRAFNLEDKQMDKMLENAKSKK